MNDARIAAIGVEEEFHILDLGTRRLVPEAGRILEVLPADRFAAELLKSVVETNSRPCRDLADLRADLLDLRRLLVAAARPFGLGPVAAGTVPIVDTAVLEISRDPRYEQMLDDYQILAREQLICGAQVHVDVVDRDLAMAVTAWLAPWLPMLLALSASSPYWKGIDSGYASMRTLVWQRWPTAGVAGPFSTAAEYDQLVADLIKSGVISDPGMVYFDVRPSAHLPTVELRICDACPDVDNVILIAGLFRALVRRATDALAVGEPAPPPRPELLRAATWRAARSGLEGELVDLAGAGPVPAEEMLRRLMSLLRGELEEAGDWELVTVLAEQAIGRGSAAARQRRAFARRGRLADVADLVLAETKETSVALMLAGTLPAEAANGSSSLLAGYAPPLGFDEVVAAESGGSVEIRAPYRSVVRALDRLGPATLEERERACEAELVDRGVVFRVTGDDEARPFPLDLLPRIVDGSDWNRLQTGLSQRVRALELFLRDAYGERACVGDGVVPDWVVDGAPGFLAGGRDVPSEAIRATVAGIDLVRDGDGAWRVLEDNLRVPSGVGYALTSRELTTRVLPEMAPPAGIVPLDGVPALLHEALVAAAPPRVSGEPVVAVLSDGPDNSAFFEHSLLADEMGVPVVTPSDLVVTDGVVSMVEASGARRTLDVLYRRVDEDDLFGATAADGSPLGPALAEAVRAGRVSLANAPGNGVGDDKVLYAYVPALIRYFLGERPCLADVRTYVCGDADQRGHVLDHLDELVLKPVDGYGGAGIVIGPRAGAAELERARAAVEADPRGWVAQETIALSTHPTWRDGRLVPCSVDLRAFVYQGEDVVVAPAALTRVAPPGSLIVNSSRGGGAKDTWLLR
jgi:carboxylate-amine ligase